MKKEALLIYFSEKKLLNDIRKIKNTTIYVMKDFEKTLEKVLNTNIAVNYKFPWERLFEVEVDFN